jgi:DNA (cytosine-5)-methyltransferase 1
MDKKNVLELFGGCGGLGYGFHKQNFNIECCNELEQQIANTYIYNYPYSNVIVGDITQNDIKKKIYSHFKNKECHILIGGPPCVAYSLSGKRDPRDPRGQLFKDYIEIVKKLKPEICVMENVKGILNMLHDKDNLNNEEKKQADEHYDLEKKKIILEDKNKHKTITDIEKEELVELKKQVKTSEKNMSNIRIKVSEKIKKTFSKIGYNVEYKLLNAANYGVPQLRERVIFIAVRNDLGLNITFPIHTHSKDASNNTKKWVSVKEAIDDLKTKEEDKKLSHIFSKHSPEFVEKIKNTQCGKAVNPKYSEANFRCSPEQPCNTVKENHGAVFVHYEKNRSMTPRELARLQSFPDDFIFKGTKTSILKQLGNAVPCLLGENIAKNIKNMYNEKKQS